MLAVFTTHRSFAGEMKHLLTRDLVWSRTGRTASKVSVSGLYLHNELIVFTYMFPDASSMIWSTCLMEDSSGKCWNSSRSVYLQIPFTVATHNLLRESFSRHWI